MATNREYLNALADIGDGSLTDWFEQEHVEMVRCEDCKFAYELDGDMLDCHGRLTELWDYWNDEPKDNPVEPDGFCAWGERK